MHTSSWFSRTDKPDLGVLRPLLFFCLFGLAALYFESGVYARSMSINDVLAIQTVDRADVSPNSDEIAIAMPRPAGAGEVYGRNAYEIDPSRNDIWLVRRDGSSARSLTDGKSDAAGYWCPYWSPDGQRLAMLSTAPEGEEPHGGDNVRLYVWERTSDALRRVSNRAVMTQVRYGSPLNELDLRAAGARQPNTCRQNDENAPFLWLDDDRLLVVMMPPSERSAMVDRFSKFHREAAQQGSEMRGGESATVSRSDSGAAVENGPTNAYQAELVVFDFSDGSRTSFGSLPAFPMFGALTIALSPDARGAAILAPDRAIAPHLLSSDRPNVQAWAVEKVLFRVNFDDPGSLERVNLSAEARYPLDFIGWSPNSERFAFRARARADETIARLWWAGFRAGAVTALAPNLQFGHQTPSHWREPGYAFWVDPSRMLVNGAAEDGGDEWRLVDAQGGGGTPFSSGLAELGALHSLADGSLVGRYDGGDVRFDPALSHFVPWQAQDDGVCEPNGQLIAKRDGEASRYTRWSAADPGNNAITLPLGARILDHDCTGIVWAEKGFEGSFIRFASWDKPSDSALLMKRNLHLTEIDWGERRMIDYTHANGSTQQMAVMFPPDYDPAKTYPTLIWVYGGYGPSGVDNFFFDPHISAFYNLQLYASQGYVVVMPSIPIPRSEAPSEPFAAIPGGVLPALDKLVDLGITDNERVGVFGQSFGGYTVSALIAQTDRFAAAATLAGATDLATNHSSFDPAARGWSGIEQDMPANATIYEAGYGMKVDPGADPALYHRNSPLTYVDQIKTPLLLVHGELDSRAPLTQPETLYSLLRRRGRAARMLRYWGENHSLANSPANVRDISRELIDWFDRFVKREGSRTE